METRTIFHRNGEVTLWNVYTQRWERSRASLVSDQVLASLPNAERNRIIERSRRERASHD